MKVNQMQYISLACSGYIFVGLSYAEAYLEVSVKEHHYLSCIRFIVGC